MRPLQSVVLVLVCLVLARVMFLEPLMSGTPLLRRGNNQSDHQDGVLSYQVKYQSPTSLERKPSAVRFVLFLGLEGVGHHFWKSIMARSPMRYRLNALKISPLQIVGPHLYSRGVPACGRGIFSANECVVKRTNSDGSVRDFELDINRAQDIFAKGLEDMVEMAQNPPNASKEVWADRATEDNPLYVPLNAFEGGQMMSYPTNKNDNRIYQYPQVDLLYNACAKAGVTCDMVYLYRDPYSVVKSTIKRNFNPHVVTAIQLYVTMLNILHYQMLTHPNAVAGCWNFDSVLPTSNSSTAQIHQDESVKNILGWGNHSKAYNNVLRDIYSPHPPLNKTQQESIVPHNFQPLMDSMVDLHENVVHLCQSLYSGNDKGGKKHVSQAST